MTVDEITAVLLRLYESGRRFRFLDQSYRVLAQVSFAPQLALQTFRALVELGLGGPARELLDARTDLGDEDTRGRFRSAIQELADGNICWSERKTIFVQNLEAIRSYRPDLLDSSSSPVRSRVHCAVGWLT